jgi:Family of unknown function (DUF6445)
LNKGGGSPDIQLDTHPDLRIRVEHVGAERIPLLIVDDLVDRPDDLVAFAATDCTLAPPTDMYPGLRAPAPKSYGEVLRKGLTQAINTAYSLPDLELHSAVSYLCVVTAKPPDLKPVQCMPHIDGTAPNGFSTVHYLCSPAYAGTSLYRHRRTGYELVPDFRHDRYRAVLEQELRQAPRTPQAYINGDTEMFERIASTEVAFNRLVLYPANALHSGDIGLDFAFDPDPRRGRFSVNSRIQMRPKGFQPKPWF